MPGECESNTCIVTCQKTGTDPFQLIGEGAKNAFCNTLGIGICPIVDLVVAVANELKDPANNGNIGKAFESLFRKFKVKLDAAAKSAETRLKGLFENFRNFLTLKDDSKFLEMAWTFATKVFDTASGITTDFTALIGLPRAR